MRAGALRRVARSAPLWQHQRPFATKTPRDNAPGKDRGKKEKPESGEGAKAKQAAQAAAPKEFDPDVLLKEPAYLNKMHFERNAPQVLPTNDLDDLFATKKDEELQGKFVNLGFNLLEAETSELFGDLEWHAKMFTVNGLDPAYEKQLREPGDYEGRYDEFILVPETERFALIRQPAIQLVREMSQLHDDNGYKGKSFARLITGKRGTGKSATMKTALAWARDAGWLTMYLPHASDLVSYYGVYFSGTEGPVNVIPESTVGKGLFQQPNAGKAVLRMMDFWHGQTLAQLPIKREYPHTDYKSRQGTSTLANILLRGITEPQKAADCVYDLRMELNLVEDVPVLIATDEFNSLYWPTALYFQSKPIRAHELVMAKAFRFVKNVPGDLEDNSDQRAWRKPRLDESMLPKRGVLLAATSNRMSPPAHREQLPPASFEKMDILDLKKMEIPHYSVDELETMLNWYQARGACFKLEKKDYNMAKAFTAGVPEKVARFALGSTIGV